MIRMCLRRPPWLLLIGLFSSTSCLAFSGRIPGQRVAHVDLIARGPCCSAWPMRGPGLRHHVDKYDSTLNESSRRTLFFHTLRSSLLVGTSALALPTFRARASTTDEATITDKIYLDLKVTPDGIPERLVIGLYGRESPEATNMLKQLVTDDGLPAPCKPRVEKQLQKEQLEANKVYNGCIESESKGVNYDLSTVWRVVKDDRIDMGSVSGKYVAREFVNWSGENNLRHDSVGLVSVRKGNASGFGFTINTCPTVNESLDKTHLVVGRVLENGELVRRLNEVPVVTSAKLPSSSDQLPAAPSRSCRYGGSSLYCNEYKPLQKASIVQTGVL